MRYSFWSAVPSGHSRRPARADPSSLPDILQTRVSRREAQPSFQHHWSNGCHACSGFAPDGLPVHRIHTAIQTWPEFRALAFGSCRTTFMPGLRPRVLRCASPWTLRSLQATVTDIGPYSQSRRCVGMLACLTVADTSYDPPTPAHILCWTRGGSTAIPTEQ